MATYGPFSLEDLLDNETVDVLVIDNNFHLLSAGATQLDGAGTPSTLTIGGSASRGTATVASRGDHAHGMPAFGSPVVQAFGDAAADGSSPNVSHADHRHGMPGAADTITWGRKVVASGDLNAGVYVVPSNISWVWTNVACTVQLPAPSVARPIFVGALNGTALITANGGSTVFGTSYNTTSGAPLSPTQLSQGDSLEYRADGSNWRS
jgi:hypothetical protein